MKISWNWLKQLVNLQNITPSELANKLTLAGFEVENIINQQTFQDIVLDITITANRPDINSMSSLAIEIAAILQTELKLYKNIDFNNYNKICKQINHLNSINQYKQLNHCIFREIYINHSPKWLQNYLICSDIYPNNNILDFTLFANFKWGQSIKILKLNKTQNPYPIEKVLSNSIFDKTTNSKRIISDNNTKLVTELNANNIGSYCASTIDVIIIGYIQKQEALKSKKSLDYAYIEMTDLIRTTYYNNSKQQVIYKYEQQDILPKHIICQVKNINKILGPVKKYKQTEYLSKKTIFNILQKLNFKVVDSSNKLKIYIPEERQNDIKKEIDIVEEIGRIYGFNYFTDHLPISNRAGCLSSTKLITTKIRQILRSMGLHEVINYSLRPNLLINDIKLVNPLNKEQKSLRTSLIGSLIESKLHNTNKSNEAFEVFEIGKVFIENQRFTEEYLHLAIILGNSNFYRSQWNETTSEMSWFQAKGNIEEFFERMHVEFTWSTDLNNNHLFQNIKEYLHPKRTSYINYKEQTIGLFSQINNRVAKKLGTTCKNYILELDISDLIQNIKPLHNLTYRYKPYSNYPKITRDISIQINKYIKMQDILNIIRTMKKEGIEILESITIFDEFYETQTTKRIGLRTTYRSQNSTLTNEKIETMETILKSRFYKELVKSKS